MTLRCPASLFFSVMAAIAFPVMAQKPVIAPGGVVNAASYAGSGVFHGLAANSIASIFGSNLASGTQQATGFPLPTNLLGTSVLVNGVAAPLFFVSPNQLNFQIPNKLGTQSTRDYTPVSLAVITTLGRSDSFTFDSSPTGPGLFTGDGTGCGRGAILNIADSGAVSLNSPENSVSPGGYITVFGTGFGYTSAVDGVPSLSSGYDLNSYGVLGGLPVRASFAGLAPGLVAVNQLNVQVPPDAQEGCAVPLRLTNIVLHNYSQPVTLSIHRGGGPCVDPAPVSKGQISLTKTIVSGSSRDGSSETLEASFPASPGGVDPQPLLTGYGYNPGPALPSCPIPGYQKWSAGPLSLSTDPAFSVGVLPSGKDDQASYSIALPSGTLKPGVMTITSTGSTRVGAFQTSIDFGNDIEILTAPPSAGSDLNTSQILTYRWRGGDPSSQVSVKLTGYYGLGTFVNGCSAPAAAGQCTLGYSTYMHSVLSFAGFYDQGDLVFDVSPMQPSTFAADGLSAGGQISWHIQHRFSGFSINKITGN